MLEADEDSIAGYKIVTKQANRPKPIFRKILAEFKEVCTFEDFAEMVSLQKTRTIDIVCDKMTQDNRFKTKKELKEYVKKIVELHSTDATYKKEVVMAEIRYKNDENEKWTFAEKGIWHDTEGKWTIVEQSAKRKLTIINDGDLSNLSKKTIVNVRLKRKNGKPDLIEFDNIIYE